MVEEPRENGSGRIETTIDHETIRTWVERRGSTAARVTEAVDDDPGSLAVVPEDTDDDSVERIPWEEFFRIFEEENLAFVHQTERDDPDERWFCRFVDREREVDEEVIETERSTGWGVVGNGGDGSHTGDDSSESDAVDRIKEPTGESTVEEGAVAETEVTRTEIVEKEVVVTDRVRSRVVGSEVVERSEVDSSVIDREVDRCEIVDEESIETEVVETRRTTEELFEVHTVESEVIERDRVEREPTTDDPGDAVDRTTQEPAVTLAEGGLENGAIVESEAVRRDLARSDLAEGSTVETEVVERRVLESEIADRVLIRSEIEDVEHVEDRTLGAEVLESEVVERERAASASEEGIEPERRTGPGSGVGDGDANTTTDTPTGPVETPSDRPSDATERDVPRGVEPTEEAEGKTVVNAYGEEVGVVSAVRDGTLYVEPDPGLTETVASRFGWDGDDGAHPIEAERIERIDDEVEIARL
jgi:hypothetical protein